MGDKKRLEVKDVLLWYMDCDAKNDGACKEVKQMVLTKAIIISDEHGACEIDREISIPKGEAGNVPDNIQLVSMIYMESRSI